MAELWIPGAKEASADNIFDMMVLLQLELDTQGTDEKEKSALLGLRFLSEHLRSLHPEQRELTLVTDLAVIDDTTTQDSGAILKSVGMRGFLNDVDCISLNEQLPSLQYSLNIDVMSLFPPEHPTDADLVLAGARTPIVKVNYIETAA